MFKDLKVIELASVLAGPDVGMFFAELGANVIKVENKTSGGDVTRYWKSKNEDSSKNVSAYFSSVNYNKIYLSLDLNNINDRDSVYSHLKEADIVITNFKPGASLKLKMDYESIKKINPSIIYGEINGYGNDSKRSAYDVVLQAETGFMSINGTKESGPLKMPIALIDVLAAHQLKEGLLIALLQKEKTNKGAYVEVSLYDAALASLKNQATNWLMGRFVPEPMGSLHPNIAPYGETFLTKDKKLIVLAIGSNNHFKRLLEILDANEIINDDRYSNNQNRVKNRESLSQKLTPYFLLETQNKIIKKLIENDIPAGAINNIQEVFEQKKAAELILEETIEGIKTKRVKTAIFKITSA